MNKKLTALVLTGAMACAMALPAMAAGNTATPTSTPGFCRDFCFSAGQCAVLWYGAGDREGC